MIGKNQKNIIASLRILILVSKFIAQKKSVTRFLNLCRYTYTTAKDSSLSMPVKRYAVKIKNQKNKKMSKNGNIKSNFK